MNQPIYFRKAYISLGANLPFAGYGPADTFKRALIALDCVDLQLVRVSSVWSSPAWPNASDPEFCNAVAIFMCNFTPLRLLNRLAVVEDQFGRKRLEKNSPRSLDLDLISYGELKSATKRVKLPHPRLHDRAFVLFPLQEVEASWKHPGSDQNVTDLIAKLPKSDVLATKIQDAL